MRRGSRDCGVGIGRRRGGEVGRGRGREWILGEVSGMHGGGVRKGGRGGVRGLKYGVGVERDLGGWGGGEEEGDCRARVRSGCCGSGCGCGCEGCEVCDASECVGEIGWCGGFGGQYQEEMFEGVVVVMLVVLVGAVRVGMRFGLRLLASRWVKRNGEG